MPIRICQLITTLQPAGAERCVYELATRLDPNRFSVQVAALQGGAVADELRASGVNVSILNVRSKFSPLLPLKLRALTHLLRDERIDLLHTHLYHADLAGRLAAKKAGVPHLVHTVHVAEDRWRPWQFSFARRMQQRCARIVCVSESVMAWHSALAELPNDHYQVIPNGIDSAAFVRDESARESYRRQWGVGENEIVALFVGRLDRQKGVDVLLSAMENVDASVRLIIAGDGSMRRKVESFCQSPRGDRCLWLGYCDDVPGVLSVADVFVLPSRTEGWPLALGEAMAAGLPTVTSNAAGIRDVAIPETTGLVVPVEDATLLAEAIERVAADEDLRRRLGTAGRERIAGQFSIEAMIQGHERLYEGIVG